MSITNTFIIEKEDDEMLIDTHWHPDKIDSTQLDSIMKENTAAGIGASIIAGIQNDYENNGKIINISQRYKNTFFATGDHPRRLTQRMKKKAIMCDIQRAVPERLIKMLQEEECLIADRLAYLDKEKEKINQLSVFYEEHREQMVAIGETGLDYSTPDISEMEKAIQSAVFHMHIRKSLDLKLPLILHIRPSSTDSQRVYDDAYRILKSYKTRFNGVLHCFCSDLSVAMKFVDLGFLLGIGGMIFNPNIVREMETVIKTIPLEALVLETDAPYLMPVGFQSEYGINTPAMTIPAVAGRISQMLQKKTGDTTVEEQTTENAIRVFSLSLM